MASTDKSNKLFSDILLAGTWSKIFDKEYRILFSTAGTCSKISEKYNYGCVGVLGSIHQHSRNSLFRITSFLFEVIVKVEVEG